MPSISKEELVNALRESRLNEPHRGDENGPVKNPVDRFVHLPETTRAWLEALRIDDLREIDDVRRWYRNTRIITTFGKWMVVAVVSVLVGTGQVGEVLFKALRIITGAP